MDFDALKRWAHAPWHCWLKEEKQWLEIFAELWSRLPAPVFETLIGRTRPLIVLPPVQQSRIVRITESLPVGAHILQLDTQLLQRPRPETLGILAHELAHIYIAATGDMISVEDLTNDLKADSLARQWGFEAELTQALCSDFDSAHPRRVLAKAA